VQVACRSRVWRGTTCVHGSDVHLDDAGANAYLVIAACVAAMAQERLTARPACDEDAYQDRRILAGLFPPRGQ
jgi:hypothetical protein